jgi:uncharacterized membrane protein
MLDFFLNIWYNFLGYAACHQMPERTICFDGRPLFVCCRCSGIYIGYFISYLFIYFTGRDKARNFPRKNLVLSGLFISSLMLIDVGTVILGLRHGANDIRIITGLLAGMSLPFVVFPEINRLFSDSGGEEKRVIDGIIPFLVIIIFNLCIFFVIKTGRGFLFWPFFLVVASGFILLYVNFNTIFLLFFLRIIGRKSRAFYKIVIISSILSFFEILPVYCLYKALGIKP